MSATVIKERESATEVESSRIFSMPSGGAIEAAEVLEVRGPRHVAVKGRSFGGLLAEVAVSGYRPRKGDRVVIARGSGEEAFLIGVLRALREPVEKLEAKDGSAAAIERGESGESLVVRDREGTLLFEYLPEEGKSVVHAATPKLELRASEGVRIASGGPIALESPELVRLASAEGSTGATVDVRPDGVVLAGPSLDLRAKRAEVKAGELDLQGETIELTADRFERRVGLLKTVAGRLIEKAKESFREVEGLSQTRAGRVRYVAEKAFHLLGQRTVLKAKKEMKIKGEKIYLS